MSLEEWMHAEFLYNWGEQYHGHQACVLKSLKCAQSNLICAIKCKCMTHVKAKLRKTENQNGSCSMAAVCRKEITAVTQYDR